MQPSGAWFRSCRCLLCIRFRLFSIAFAHNIRIAYFGRQRRFRAVCQLLLIADLFIIASGVSRVVCEGPSLASQIRLGASSLAFAHPSLNPYSGGNGDF